MSEIDMISKTLPIAIISFILTFLKLTKILGKTLTLEGQEVPITPSSSQHLGWNLVQTQSD
jgi:hypothetical protein